ncbi:hypothetical protein [Streptomyces sp. NBC_00151]|uniref:hypothetical protein n=1 Tax=Streptomyces sp. NBC_00151 TaxID=2975669 RepID=UPI002DD9875F|nr:hypothetical protein [Streptomyces sp. NBC_00151]WRZ42768.1 hypothetical protein OG915_34885 [Streptomyces sp. NBC_00151]
MESTETTQQIGPWSVRALWTEEGPFPSEIHITATGDSGATGFGITNSVLRDVKLIHPNPPEAASAMNAALDSLRTVRDYRSDGNGPVNDDYLKALSAAYVAMSKTTATEPAERMSYFLPDDSTTIENHLAKARELGFLE